MRNLLLAAAVASTACSDPAPAPARELGAVVTSLGEIAGPWDIARFGGYEPARLHGGVRRAYVDVGADGLSYVIECNYSGNPARIDAQGILHDEGDGTRVSTAMGCGPEGEAREGAFYGFFRSRPRVTWLGDKRLRMTDGRTDLILERPEARRLAHVPPLAELRGEWVPQMAVELLDANGHRGWGFQKPGILTIAGEALSYTGCGGVAFRFRYTEAGRLVTESSGAPGPCGIETPGTMLLRVLSNGPLVERTAGGGIALTSGDEAITLETREQLRRRLEAPPTPPPADPAPPPPR